MAKVSGPLFSESASGLMGTALAFRSGSKRVQVARAPRRRKFKSPRVLGQQAAFKACARDWHALPWREKNNYKRAGKGDLSGFAVYLQENGVTKCTVGFNAPSVDSFAAMSDAFLASGVALAGPSLYLAAGAVSGTAVYGPFSLSTAVTVFSAEFAVTSSIAYGYALAVFVAVSPPGSVCPPAVDFVPVSESDDLSVFCAAGSLSNKFLWIKIVFSKL